MTKKELETYAYQHRNLAVYQRRELAQKKIEQAIALLEDEIFMQNSYAAMDYGTLPMGGYKKAVEYLKSANKELDRS